MKLSIVLLMVSQLLGTSLFAAKWKAPKRKAKKKNPIAMTDDSVKKGKAVYTQECAECHGDTGKGDGPKSGDIEVEMIDLALPEIMDQTDGALWWKITVGKRPMPSYKKLLNKEDRWHVVNYLRDLKKQRGK